jgi:arsenate reductase
MLGMKALAMGAAAVLSAAGTGSGVLAAGGEEPGMVWPERAAGLYPEVESFLKARSAEFDRISPERRERLEEISGYIRRQRASGRSVDLIFVCTHNSRRSQMSQLWVAAAAEVYGIDLTTYSGGTEDTAFNPRAVAAMERAGFRIEKTTDAVNPVYHAKMGEGIAAATCFSKAYDQPPNPKEGFAAVMVCSDADESCPIVMGADGRFSLPFVDPKVSDGTASEAATYDERCAQIAREMLYMVSRVDG